jgi:hypothetical protein
MDKKDNLALHITIILGFLFIIGYIAYPFVVAYVIPYEQEVKWYVKKFDKIRPKLETVINECEKLYWKEFENKQEVTLYFDDLPEKAKKIIKKEDLYIKNHTFVSIKKEGEKLIIYARFDNYNVWQLRRFPFMDMVLYYHSEDKNEKRPENIQNGRLIVLGDGWSLFDEN